MVSRISYTTHSWHAQGFTKAREKQKTEKWTRAGGAYQYSVAGNAWAKEAYALFPGKSY